MNTILDVSKSRESFRCILLRLCTRCELCMISAPCAQLKDSPLSADSVHSTIRVGTYTVHSS